MHLQKCPTFGVHIIPRRFFIIRYAFLSYLYKMSVITVHIRQSVCYAIEASRLTPSSARSDFATATALSRFCNITLPITGDTTPHINIAVFTSLLPMPFFSSSIKYRVRVCKTSIYSRKAAECRARGGLPEKVPILPCIRV